MKILKQFFSVLFVLLCVVGTGYAATFDGVRDLYKGSSGSNPGLNVVI